MEEKIIIKEYNSGISIKRIATKHNTYFENIRKILIKFGIERRDYSHMKRIYNLNENFFEDVNNEEKAYWLGFIYADGYVNPEQRTLSIELGMLDKGHLKKFLNSLQSNHKIHIYGKKDRIQKYPRIKIKNKKLTEDLSKNGLMSKKSNKIKFPNLNKQIIRHFIRGYFDGDGSVAKNKMVKHYNKKLYPQYKVSFVGNLLFIKEIQSIICFENNLKLNKLDMRNENTCSLNFCKLEDIKKVYRWLYYGSNLFLDRKKEMMENVIRN